MHVFSHFLHQSKGHQSSNFEVYIECTYRINTCKTRFWPATKMAGLGFKHCIYTKIKEPTTNVLNNRYFSKIRSYFNFINPIQPLNVEFSYLYSRFVKKLNKIIYGLDFIDGTYMVILIRFPLSTMISTFR